MLVMTTIFISKMEGLPPTSATKMIDYWLILCQLVPFTQVVLLTTKEHIRDEELQDENQKEFIGEASKKTITRSLTTLTIIGKFHLRFLFLNRSFISETKVMPMIVLSASVLYFVIAANFYSA